MVVGIQIAALYSPVWTGAVVAPIDIAIVGGAVVLLVQVKAPPIGAVAPAMALPSCPHARIEREHRQDGRCFLS